MSAQSLPGLYIHIPFCRTKCPYCDFYSSTDMALAQDFFFALEKELLLYRENFSSVHTVYVGGGTPTVLPDELLAAIMAMVRQHVAVAPDAEITIEANPNDLSRERLANLRSLGFNRLSLGVQSFDDGVLRFLGRRHTANEARHCITRARQAGLDTISLDLMYGIPGQKQESWLQTMGEALRFSPEHLSCYQLTIKEGTPFSRSVQEGKIEPCPDDEQAELFMATAAFLEARGYSQYEVSSFARAEHCQARHNRTYWEHAPYLGLGPSAHSFDGRRRWWNVASVEEYIRVLLQGRASGQAGMGAVKELDSGFRRNDGLGALPVECTEELTDDQLRSEKVMLGLRMRKGIALELVRKNPGAAQVLEKLEAEGLVTISGGRVRPTTRGMLMADSLAVLL